MLVGATKQSLVKDEYYFSLLLLVNGLQPIGTFERCATNLIIIFGEIIIPNKIDTDEWKLGVASIKSDPLRGVTYSQVRRFQLRSKVWEFYPTNWEKNKMESFENWNMSNQPRWFKVFSSYQNYILELINMILRFSWTWDHN